MKYLKANMMNKIAVTLFTVSILLSFIACINQSQAQNETIAIGIAPSTLTVNQGELFNITVYINNMPEEANLTGVQFKVTWDSAVLAGVSMTEILYTENTPAGEEDNIWRIKHVVTATYAEYAYAYMDTTRALSGGYVPIHGNLTVATITLNATAETGHSTVRFDFIKLAKFTGTPIFFNWKYPNTVPSGFAITESLVEVGNPPPLITIKSPQNKTYGTTPIDLTFTASESTSWIGYGLDGQTNMTIPGNTTITPPDGTHYVIVYANDTTGNMGVSNKVYFTIDTTPPEASFLYLPEEPEAELIFGAWKWKVLVNASASQDSVTKIVSYNWDFGDGTSGSGKSLTHTYRQVGSYNITLTVKDSADNIGSKTVTLKLTEPTGETPWLLITIVVIPIVFAAVIAVYYVRIVRRRK